MRQLTLPALHAASARFTASHLIAAHTSHSFLCMHHIGHGDFHPDRLTTELQPPCTPVIHEIRFCKKASNHYISIMVEKEKVKEQLESVKRKPPSEQHARKSKPNSKGRRARSKEPLLEPNVWRKRSARAGIVVKDEAQTPDGTQEDQHGSSPSTQGRGFRPALRPSQLTAQRKRNK